MRRRQVLLRGMAAIAVWPLFGHTPFPQWKVYRQRHLFIVVDRQDPVACDLGRAIAHTLAEELPTSRAMITRAGDAFRLASLISTRQLDVGLVPRSQFTAWQQHSSPYDQLEPVVLQEIYELGDYVLISRDDFLAEHRAIVAQVLQAHPSADRWELRFDSSTNPRA